MNKITKIAIRKYAFETWGPESQILKATEELSELIKELVKYLLKQGDLDKITDEMADVENMMDQLRENIFLNGKAVELRKQFKLHRVAKRLGMEEVKGGTKKQSKQQGTCIGGTGKGGPPV